MSVTWNYENAAHLLRRVAFGGTPDEIQAFLDGSATVDDAVSQLLAFPSSKKKPPGPRDVDDFQRLKMQRWWFKYIITSRTPADATREKLVLFLHNHLVSGSNKQPTLKYMALQNQLFRTNVRTDFKTLVRLFNRDPANLYYLDGIYNVASTDSDPTHVVPYATPNENWGRELMELFTLGRFQMNSDGTPNPAKVNYTENDVHNMARACTGWTDIKGKEGVWNQGDWDGGKYDDNADGVADPMVIFGQSSNNFRIDDGVANTPDDVLSLIFGRTDDAGNNQVAMFLTRKLWTWYAYPPPTPSGLFANFAATFAGSSFDPMVLLQAMFTHDEFYSDAAKSRSVRNPVDFIVGSMRALALKKTNGEYVGPADRELGDQARLMGMNLFEPPNVAGWPGGLEWINSGTLLARLDHAKNLAASDFGRNRIRLSDITDLPLGNALADPGVIVDALVHQLGLDVGPAPIDANQRAALIAYATDGGTNATLDLSDEFTTDATVKVRGLLSLLLQSAEYQLF
jgi:uncharacterized protein (DUF1800 family)